MIWLWMRNVIATRLPHLAFAAAGIIAATALVGTIGVFGDASSNSMTQRALTAVPVDWQIAIAAGADPALLIDKLPASAAIRASRTIGYADVAGLKAVTGDSTQDTGAGKVLGLPADYATTFPGQMRPLVGAASGVLLAQQTASNLRVTVGETITIRPAGVAAFDVKIDGVVDLPNANAQFQTIGPAQGPAPTAPPDNIVMLPLPMWQAHFNAAAQVQGGIARYQVHVALDRGGLPSSPDAALSKVSGMARNFEVRAAGLALVGDNLAARLAAVRQDAMLARLLMLFLGLPGIVLALLVTVSILRADADRRRREQAMLGLRGASAVQILALAAVDAGAIAVIGSVCGVALAAALAGAVLGIDLSAAATWQWLLAAGVLGFVISLTAVLVPTWADLRNHNVAARRAWLGSATVPLWRRIFADIGLIVVGGAIYWHSASTGYQVVLAPEGVTSTSVDYTAFLAPLLFWVGCGLLTLRLTENTLRRGRSALAVLMAPLAGRLSQPAAAALSRQSVRIAAGTALVALAISFASATALFNTTYETQLLVDARLTNGADVTVTGSNKAPAAAALDAIRATGGVAAAEPMQHRFAYVGKDLQDLYGIDPARIANATSIADAYFGNRDAHATLARLAATEDGVLVSQETVNDFQLALGDTLNLRLQSAADHGYKAIPFHFVGIVNEFPTAPRDSFLVANSAYVAAQTGDAASEIVLVRANGNPEAVSAAIRTRLGDATNLKTTDVSQATHLIGSSLTAVDLRALSAVELAFAVLFVAMATGLTLWLGQSDRARTNAIMLSLGASRAEMRSFLWGEGLIMLTGGLILGAPIGAASAWMLVRLLSAVFDPPPDALAAPWSYLAVVAAAAIIATVAAVVTQGLGSKEWAARELRAGR